MMRTVLVPAGEGASVEEADEPGVVEGVESHLIHLALRTGASAAAPMRAKAVAATKTAG